VQDPTVVSYSLAGIAMILLGYLFRTLWRQDEAWKGIIEEERASAAIARSEAAAAKISAADAQVVAAAANARALRAEVATEHCEHEHQITRDQLTHTTNRLEALIAHLRALGISFPDNWD